MRGTNPFYLLISACALMITALAVTGGAVAQTTENPPAMAGQPQGAAERVAVHGYWTIDVADADGSPASHTEFENALDPQGATTLIGLLSRSNSMGQWRVELSAPAGALSPCAAPIAVSGASSSCILQEPGLAALGDGSVRSIPDGTSNTVQLGESGTPNLTVFAGIGPDAGKLVLAGTLTARSAGAVGQARTFAVRCPPSSSPGAPCSSGLQRIGDGLQPFTVATLAEPVTVTPGQILQVNVAITFSCANPGPAGCGSELTGQES